jgi:hypothetical protein
MPVFFKKLSGFTAVPVGSGGVSTLTALRSGSYAPSQSETEFMGEGSYPIIIPGSRKDATITVATADLGAYGDIILKQYYTDVEITSKLYNCSTGAEENYVASISRAILSEISEITMDSEDGVKEFTLTFKAVSNCDGSDPVCDFGPA